MLRFVTISSVARDTVMDALNSAGTGKYCKDSADAKVICRPCVAEKEGRKPDVSKEQAAKEPDWRCLACAEYAAAFTVRFALLPSSQTSSVACPTLFRVFVDRRSA